MDTSIASRFESKTFLTNAGTETYLVFQQGFELPEFCAFVVHEDEEAWAELEKYYVDPILRTAGDSNFGLILDALVWRAHSDFIKRLGRDPDELTFPSTSCAMPLLQGWSRQRRSRTLTTS